MTYVDGFVIPVPKKKIAAYKKMAAIGKNTWLKCGAIDYKECVGEDLKSKWGTPFSKMMKLKPGETVVFAYIVYRSRQHRDQVNAKVMKEMEADSASHEMPFDIKRMVYGGFKTLVE